MFNRNTCTACGTCLVECPFLDITRKHATEEVARLVQGTGSREIIRSCTVCGYCDVICPTGSNPSHLREEILHARNRDKGVPCLWLMSEEVPANLMTVGLEFEREEKSKRLARYSETASSKEVCHLGCSLSHIHTDLAETALLDDLPKIGGLKFCCGAFVRESMCCGLPMSGRDPKLATEVAEKRVLEAAEAGAEVIAVGCTGCFALSDKAAEHGLDLYHITELAQLAVGEEPRHRIAETRARLAENLLQCIGKDPELLQQRYVIRNGEVVPL